MKNIADTTTPPGVYAHPELRYAEALDDALDDGDMAGVGILIERGYQEWVQRFGRACAYCGMGFIPKKNLWARYCSDSHRVLDWRRRTGRR